jgi:beta-phosphoglucomutase-like phosphatase (HAD superfamily)
MSITAQKRAIKNYRVRLQRRGMARFEVLGLDRDRDLIRTLAKRLAEDTNEANEIRTQIAQSVAEPSPKGGILAALRRSPLIGAGLDIIRSADTGRKIDL